MKCILSLFFILFNTFLFGQNMYLAKPVTHFVEVYDEKGNLFGGNVGSIKGSPLWKDEWCNANVEMFNGKTFSNMKLIVNLVNGNIHFLEKDAEFQFIEPVKKITLLYSTEGRIDSTIFIKMAANNNLLYEVKARGSKYLLLDLVQKKAADTYDYGKSSGGKEFRVFNESFLYNLTTSELITVKGKTLTELFKDDTEKIPSAFNKAKKKPNLKEIAAIIAAW
ncbi:hypothetical protein [Sediminibacterium sp.]|uniref:hypothetical protein n=2 Tax=Sediminibacterium sp. TaxID=1917865 RepID=UPI0025D10078|nr:hypothetical protein [Sediminibacterium sp.]MDP2422388.1 hypothetical protein [Sediminibacterium sp.]